MKSKKTKINTINHNDKYFWYAASVTLNHNEFEKKIIKGLLMKIYYWEEINYLSGKDGWKKFEKNNPADAPDMFYFKKVNINRIEISKHN